MALVRLLWAFWLMSSFHVGSAAAHLFCLYQTYSGGFCWKSKKAHDFLCVRGLFLGKTYTILGCYKQHVFLKTCTELKASIQKKKKSHIFLFLPALMSHSTEEKPRLSKKGEFAFDGASELGEQSLLGVSLSVSLWAPVSFVFRMVKRNFFLKDTSALHLIQPSNIFCPLCGCNFGFDWERKKKKPSLQRILNSLLTPQVYFSTETISQSFSHLHYFRSLAIYSASSRLRRYEAGMKLKSLWIRCEGMCVDNLLRLVVNCPFNLNTPLHCCFNELSRHSKREARLLFNPNTFHNISGQSPLSIAACSLHIAVHVCAPVMVHQKSYFTSQLRRLKVH